MLSLHWHDADWNSPNNKKFAPFINVDFFAMSQNAQIFSLKNEQQNNSCTGASAIQPFTLKLFEQSRLADPLSVFQEKMLFLTFPIGSLCGASFSPIRRLLTMASFSVIWKVVGGGLLQMGAVSPTSITLTSRLWLLVNGPIPNSSTSS